MRPNCQHRPTRHAITDRAVKLGPCAVEDTGPAWDNRRSGGPSPTMTARADRLTKRAKTPTRFRGPIVLPCEQCASSSMRSNG